MTKLKKIGNYSYDLDKKLGSGNFSQVFEGFHNNAPQEKIAVKVLEKLKMNQFEAYLKQAFYEEIAIMMKLKSENILKFIHVNETKNRYYIMLELANEGTLRDILEKKDKQSNQIILSENEVYGYLIQILNGFKNMVKLGVVHRNFTPDNIFIKDGILKIGQFDFAKEADLDISMQTVVGTPSYMAPQIMEYQRYNYKCDIWSLGIIVYQMMTGQLPFKFKDLNIGDFQKIIEDTQIAFPQKIAISENMKNFILGCLKVDEKQRFDWLDVFTHPLFFNDTLKKFQKTKQYGKSFLKIVFILGQIKTAITLNKFNLKKQIQKIKKSEVTTEEFEQFLQKLFGNLEKADICTLSNYFSKQNKIKLEDFQNILLKYGCVFIETVNTINTEAQYQSIDLKKQTSQKSQTYLIKKQIAKALKQNNIDIYDLVKEQQANGNQITQINFDLFMKIIKKIVPNIPEQIVLNFYEQDFGSQKLKSFSIKTLYKHFFFILEQFSKI